MAKIILSIPEERGLEVIDLIRSGVYVYHSMLSRETRDQLIKWCNEQEKYLKGE